MLPTKAIISFIVSSVAYTPETYTVVLWASSDQLNTTNSSSISTNTTGVSFLTDTNLTYRINLEHLRSTQKYYYYVLAMNTIGTNRSEVNTFTTSEPREINVLFHLL